MNYEKLMLLKALNGDEPEREEAFKGILARGVDASYFFIDPLMWKKTLEYKRKYGKYPTRKTFERMFSITEVIPIDEPIEYYTDELVKTKRYRVVATAMNYADKEFENGNVDTAIASLKLALKTAEATLQSTDLVYTQSVDVRKADYEKRILHPGVDGIPSGLAKLDAASFGWHNGELIMLAAPTGSYKTWTMLYMVRAAMLAGYKPLVCTVEMPGKQLARRMDSIMTSTEFERIRSGKFEDAQAIARFQAEMDKLKNGPECIFMGGVSFGPLLIQSKIDEYQPDIVFVDGFYLMNDDSGGARKQQWEMLMDISKGLKETARAYDIPVFFTTQSWESSKKGSKGAETISNLAFSQAVGNNIDIGMIIGRVYDVILESFTNRIWLKVVKMREGEPVKFMVELDFTGMAMRPVAMGSGGEDVDKDESEEELVEGIHYNKGADKLRVKGEDEEDIPW